MWIYILLGIVQGLTEFLPVSSSGHLAILQRLFGMQDSAVAVSVILHAGTLCAMVVFFFKDIIKLLRSAEILFYIFVITVLTGVIGVGGKHFFEGLFVSPKAVAVGWCITAAVLLLTGRFRKGTRDRVGIKDAIILGFTQGMAIAPGVSRAGITMSTLLFRGFNGETSFRFSFLAAMPAIAGAALLEAKEVHAAVQLNTAALAAGFFFSFVAGFFALWFLRNVMRKAKLHYFGVYCLVIAVLTFIFVK